MDHFVELIKAHALRQSASRQRGLPYPLSEQQIAAAEQTLGFCLPHLLRQIYLEVANGGFGPGVALTFPGGISRLSQSVEAYQRSLEDDEDEPIAWPEGLLPLCDWGCGRFSSIDCIHSSFPIIYHHPEIRENEGGIETAPGFAELRECLDENGFFIQFGGVWGNSWVVTKSFQSWLNAWLNDEDIESMGYPRGMYDEKHRSLPFME